MASTVTPFAFRIPATTANLGPGFGVLGIALELWLEFAVSQGEDALEVRRLDAALEAPRDLRHDPIARGIRAASEGFGIKVPAGMVVEVRGDVPRGCGLGTNTAELAAGIQLACRFAKDPPSLDERLTLLVAIGGDAAHGGAALRGGLTAAVPCHRHPHEDVWRILNLPISPVWRFVVVAPDVALGTADVHRVVPATVPNSVAQHNAGRIIGLVEALAHGDHDLLRECLFDETHVPFRMRLAPGMPEAARAGRDAGAAGVTISGHGPALLAFAGSDQDARKIADAMIGAFAAHGITSRAEVARAAPRF